MAGAEARFYVARAVAATRDGEAGARCRAGTLRARAASGPEAQPGSRPELTACATTASRNRPTHRAGYDARMPLLDRLRELIGAAHVLTGDAIAAWETDWRRRARGRALAVARPADTAEVAAVVRACAAHGVPIVPQGGNTGLVQGGIPDASGTQLVLSLARLDRVRALDADNQTLTVEAGCVLARVQQAAADAGLLFPLSLAAEGSCTIGGNLATNAGGTQVLRYGNARELCLGLEVVTPAGEVWDGLSGLRKDNTGYDLRDLYVGSEGTLGVITAATLKLHPQPRARGTAFAASDSLAHCVRLLALASRTLGPALTGFELMGRAALALVERHFPQLPRPLAPAPWTVLVEQADALDEAPARERMEALLVAAQAEGLVTDAVLAGSTAQRRALWRLRESIPLAEAAEGANAKHDIALPISAIPAFVAAGEAALQAAFPGARVVNFGHLGDGNLHYNVQPPAGADPAAWLQAHEPAVHRLVHDAVAARGGSISAEHGIGALKRGELARYEGAVAMGLMRAIKQALDPRGLMNPGRVL